MAGLGGDLWAWLQSMRGGTGPGAGNVGPVNGFLPDPTQTPPNPAYGRTTSTTPNSSTTIDIAPGAMPLWMKAAIGGPAGAAAAVMTPTPTASDDQAPTNLWNQRPSGVATPSPPPFNWLTSTGAGMSAPAGSPGTYPPPEARPSTVPPPAGPLASSAAAGAKPMKRRAGAANLGYYAGGNSPTSMGGARNPTWTPYTNPQDPRIYRG